MTKQTIFVASDHAGFDFKASVISQLESLGLEVNDLGCDSKDSVHYPDYGHKLAQSVLAEDGRGILICGTGIGMSITANRYKGIRAALCHSVEYAQLSREHNNSNVLILGARFTDEALSKQIVDAWLNTDFAGGRHQERLEMIEVN